VYVVGQKGITDELKAENIRYCGSSVRKNTTMKFRFGKRSPMKKRIIEKVKILNFDVCVILLGR